MCNVLVLIEFECTNQIIRYNMEWIFDGIGTAILSSLVSLLVGGGIGYRVGINKNKVKQKQKAGDHASQIQIGRDGHVR
jgi:hypothetical protein